MLLLRVTLGLGAAVRGFEGHRCSWSLAERRWRHERQKIDDKKPCYVPFMNQAIQLDEKARNLAKIWKETEGELLDVLMEMRRSKSFLALGFTGVWDYCVRGLKLGEANAFYFKKVAEKAEEVPELKAAIDKGVLSVSQARRIAPVITNQNSETWIAKAAVLKQRELERAVAKVNPSARPPERLKPTEIRVGIDPTLEAKIKQVQDLSSRSVRVAPCPLKRRCAQ